jgi:hypothetical protein
LLQVGLLEDANDAAIHAKRVTIMPKVRASTDMPWCRLPLRERQIALMNYCTSSGL